jgi:hypothetical protein
VLKLLWIGLFRARTTQPLSQIGALLEYALDCGPADRETADGGLGANARTAHVAAHERALSEDVAGTERAVSLGRLDDDRAALEYEEPGSRSAALDQRPPGRRLELARRCSELVELRLVDVGEERYCAQAFAQRY